MRSTAGSRPSRPRTHSVQPVVKTVTPTAVGYAATLPTGKIAHVLVRNTRPTTIETVQASAAAGEMPMKSDMNKSKGQMNPNSPGYNPNPSSNMPGSNMSGGNVPTGSSPGLPFNPNNMSSAMFDMPTVDAPSSDLDTATMPNR